MHVTQSDERERGPVSHDVAMRASAASDYYSSRALAALR